MTRIMLVEDEVIISRDVQRTLEKLGYVVCAAATSGEEAIVAALAVKPDIILMDIMLQGAMDGVDAAGEIRARLDVPVVFLTAFADDNILERAKLTRPYGYLIKPFEDRELHSTIEMAVYKHKTEDALNKQREKFISVLIHDLKGPLMAISGYARRLSEGKSEAARLPDAADEPPPASEAARLLDAAAKPPPASEVARPPASEVARPPASEVARPPASEVARPPASEAARPPASEAVRPPLSKSDIERRRVCGIIMDAAQSMLSTIEDTSKALKEKAALDKFNPRQVDFHGVLRTVLVNYSPQFEQRRLGIYFNGVLDAGPASASSCGPVTASSCGPVTASSCGPVAASSNRTPVDAGGLAPVKDSRASAGCNIHADPEQLRSMIENLVGNAVKYARSAVYVEVRMDASGLRFTVSDDGPGIPDVYREKIFEEYFQAPGSVKGTGLGLFSVKKVVDNHGGGVTVTSLPDGGTRFEITLPA